MLRISGYFISLLLISFCSLKTVQAQDTIQFPLKIRGGLELSGPAIYLSDKNIMSYEGYVSGDINEKVSAVFAAGYLNRKYSQSDIDNNYEYLTSGMFFRTGLDFNLVNPKKSMGRYWAGIGLRYGVSVFSSENPSIKKENYWGISAMSVAPQTKWGHFLEVSPGARAEIFKNVSIGWNISIRRLLYNGAGDDLRPVYLPGFGNGTKKFSSGVAYYIVWNIPYKKIRVITKVEEPETSDETDGTGTTGSGQNSPGMVQKPINNR
jgi:hypothetical protein